MAKFGKFEEIQAWQKAHDVTLLIYKTTAAGNFAKDFGLRDQIRRASVSIMAKFQRVMEDEQMRNLQIF